MADPHRQLSHAFLVQIESVHGEIARHQAHSGVWQGRSGGRFVIEGLLGVLAASEPGIGIDSEGYGLFLRQGIGKGLRKGYDTAQTERQDNKKYRDEDSHGCASGCWSG